MRRRRRNKGCVGRVGFSLITARHLLAPRRLSRTDLTDVSSARLSVPRRVCETWRTQACF